MRGKCRAFCSCVPYSSSVGPIMAVPMPATGARTPNARISSSRMTYRSLSRPAPPYSSGQIGTEKPRSAQRSSHSRWSSVIGTLVPPPGTSPGPRQLAGQLSANQDRTSLRNDIASVPSKSALATMLTQNVGTRASRTGLPSGGIAVGFSAWRRAQYLDPQAGHGIGKLRTQDWGAVHEFRRPHQQLEVADRVGYFA